MGSFPISSPHLIPDPVLNKSENFTTETFKNSANKKNSVLPPLPKVGRNLLSKLKLSHDFTPPPRLYQNQTQKIKDLIPARKERSAIRSGSLLAIPLNNKRVDDSPNSNTEGRSGGSSPWFGFNSHKSTVILNEQTPGSECTPNKSLWNFDFKSRSTHVIKVDKIEKFKNLKGENCINQYRILNLLGSGAYGKVYRAVDDKGENVAIKVYNKRVLRSRWIGKAKTAISCVYSEIQIMENLNHPNILTLFEVIDRPDYHKIFLVLEYIDGVNLYEKGKMDEKLVLRYFKQILSGLEYLHHTARVIHKDLKPQNILVDSNDEIKICDFGSAQLLDKGNCDFSSSAGTYAFMPPELHGGKTKMMGSSTDIWSLGITTYYLLEGRTPYVSRKSLELSEEIQNGDLRIPSHFSIELTDILFRMLDKNPETRASIQEIKQSKWFNMAV